MKTERSECFFTSANLQKIAELKSMSGLFFLLFNSFLNPAFCQYNVLVAQLKYTKNLYKNGIFRKFVYARKEEFYATIISFGQFIRPSSRG